MWNKAPSDKIQSLFFPLTWINIIGADKFQVCLLFVIYN